MSLSEIMAVQYIGCSNAGATTFMCGCVCIAAAPPNKALVTYGRWCVTVRIPKLAFQFPYVALGILTDHWGQCRWTPLRWAINR